MFRCIAPHHDAPLQSHASLTHVAVALQIERDLGFKLTPPEVFIADGVQSVIALGLAHPKPRKS